MTVNNGAYHVLGCFRVSTQSSMLVGPIRILDRAPLCTLLHAVNLCKQHTEDLLTHLIND